MSASERVTWENCPTCGRLAAVGWRDGVVVEVDCPGSCRLDLGDIARRAEAGGRPRLGRWTTDADTST